ncbi:pirin family protein [Vibrio injensis]|uniref:pirin family protein n=1 Tax=Vibrio injensis TaxID=1307414 RepID=UPI00093565CB|nr:pirin family protein [Vibrio injensis]
MNPLRVIEQIIPARATSDGDGVKIRRIAGFNHDRFSPFLMVDELKSDDSADYIGGFPPHPHRGIETLTYMLQGHFQHRDQMGNVGELRSGGAQWMAAGRGVIHSEMPIMEQGQLHGFQIWINQPAKYKMAPAQYHDFQPETITEYSTDSVSKLRIIAGELAIDERTLQGPLTQTGVATIVADWRAQSSSDIALIIPEHYNVLLYAYQGTVNVVGKSLKQGELAVLSRNSDLQLSASEASGVLILAGEPINEPIVHYGPFVMNSHQEIEQAIADYNAGLFATY